MEKGLWEWRSVPGKKQRQKDLFYAQEPYDIIAPYACRDTNITYKLGIHQLNAIETVDNNPILAPKLSSLVEMDKTLLKVVFDMEKTGILIDKNRCYDAIDHEERRISSVEEKIEREVGLRFDNTNKILLELFKGEQIPSRPPTKKTQKINPKFDSEAIKEFKSDFAREVLEWRDAKSRVGFYYNFLYHTDENNVVHCSFNQDGTATGRFSSSSPNLQNCAKEEEVKDQTSVFKVRSVFIPRPDYFFAMLDYDQMEYRLMLDYAGAKSMIEKVNSGLDVHTATAEDAHVSRTDAKTVNFGLIYGLGDIQLSNKLRVSLERAREIKDAILDASPEIRTFLDKVKYTAKHRKYIFNWAGRRYNFLESRFSYKAANYLIQGGCADLTKLAMVRCAKYLNNLRSRLLLTIHDELVFEVHRTEAHILPDLKKIMETVWEPRNGLALTCGVDHSFTNLSDKIEGMP
jgi:DNA polymerase-1